MLANTCSAVSKEGANAGLSVCSDIWGPRPRLRGSASPLPILAAVTSTTALIIIDQTESRNHGSFCRFVP